MGTKFPEGDIIVNCPNLTKIYLYNYGTLPNVPVPESLLSYENVEIMQMVYDKNSPAGENAKWYYGYDGKICIIPKAE